jgi:hypothetical protein
MPTRRTATLLTITQPDQSGGIGTHPSPLSRDSRRIPSGTTDGQAFCIGSRERCRRCGNCVIPRGDAVACRDRDQLWSGPRRGGWCQAESFAGAGNRAGIGDPPTPYSGYRFPTEIVSYVGWMSGVVIALDPDNGGRPSSRGWLSRNGEAYRQSNRAQTVRLSREPARQ